MSDEVLKIPGDWASELDMLVMDPDGWRKGSRLGQKGLDVPITEDEFLMRVGESTVMIGASNQPELAAGFRSLRGKDA